MNAEIYTMENCTYCQESKKLLEENNYNYTEHILTEESANTISTLQERLKIEQIIVPVIFIEGNSIVGYFGLVDFMAKKKINQGS